MGRTMGGAFWALTALLASCAAPRPGVVEVAPEAEPFVNLSFFEGPLGTVVPPEGVRGYEIARRTPAWPVIAHRIYQREGMLSSTDRRIIGLVPEEYRGVRTASMGCATCHAGKAAGVFIPGLGNKNFDVARGGSDFKLLTKGLRMLPAKRNPARRELAQGSQGYAQAIGDTERGNTTQGLVPTGMVFGWFYATVGEEIPQTLTAGAVKTPHLWGYEQKRRAGFFCDGLGDGDALAWNVGVSLTAGQSPETVASYYHRIEEAQILFNDLLPPPYPFELDASRARHGAGVFAQNCAGCHGSYQRRQDGSPVYAPPKWIPIEKVGTDSERLDIKTPQLAAAAAANPLGEKIAIKHAGRGYFAPRLEGIWSRFPYLHNGAAPNLAALLTPPEKRPQFYALDSAGERERFDERALGLTLPEPNSAAQRQLKRRAARGSRRVFDASRPGHSTKGHPFGTDLPEADKLALIEYLKTL